MAELSKEEKEFMARVLAYAKRYLARGWAVLPLHCVKNGQCTCGEFDCPQAGKHPRNEKGTAGASKSEAQIEKWFGEGAPLSNIGVACGAESGISVLDLDVKEECNGVQNYLNFADVGNFKTKAFKTLSVETGSGGRHLYFKFNSILSGTTNAYADECVGGRSGIDIRTQGNMVVAPPSKHRSGGFYKWLSEKPSETPILDFPEYLLFKNAIKRGFKIPKMNKPTLDELKAMLDVIPADDRDVWFKVFLACGRAYREEENRDEFYKACCEWAAKDKKNDAAAIKMQDDFFYKDALTSTREKQVGMGTVLYFARKNGFEGKISYENERSPLDSYIFATFANACVYIPTGEEHASEAVNKRYASWMARAGFKKKRAVDLIVECVCASSKTYAPQFKERLIFDHDAKSGVVEFNEGGCVWNTYEPPLDLGGESSKATPWVELVKKIMPRQGDAEQFIKYLAHRAQKPWEKPRFALLIGGEQGIGKDSVIEAATPAWGYCNEVNIDPNQLLSGFNEYAENVLIRVNENGDLKEGNRWQLYERAKVLIAGSPDQMELNPKYGKKYTIKMCCGVIFTTNHLDAGAIFIEKDDRRYDVIQCAKKSEIGFDDKEAKDAYFKKFWRWLKHEGGFAHVQAYLRSVDLSDFEPEVHRVTQAHTELAAAGSVADDWFLDILDKIAGEAHLDELKVLSYGVLKAYADAAGDRNSFARRSVLNLSRAGYKRLQSKLRDGRYSLKGKKHNLWILDAAGFNENAALAWADAHPQVLEMPIQIGGAGAGVDNGNPPW